MDEKHSQDNGGRTFQGVPIFPQQQLGFSRVPFYAAPKPPWVPFANGCRLFWQRIFPRGIGADNIAQ
jgi:hypothetical protein